MSLSHVLFRIDFVVWKYVCLFFVFFCSDYMYVSMTLCACMVYMYLHINLPKLRSTCFLPMYTTGILLVLLP